jgi:hypothetical protein
LLASLEATAFACVCVNDSLGKRYRKANAVFIGRPIDAAENSRLHLSFREVGSKRLK